MKKKDGGGEKKLFSFFFLTPHSFIPAPPNTHTHTHPRETQFGREEYKDTSVTCDLAPAPVQSTADRVVMATNKGPPFSRRAETHHHGYPHTYTIAHTHTHKSSCSLSPFLRLAPPLLSALQRCSPGTVCVSCSNDCKCFQCATLSCCKEPFKECKMGSSSAPLKSYYTSFILASLSPFVSVQ